MKKYLIYFLIGTIIVIVGALLKILKIFNKAEYIYIIGFIFELYAIIKIIQYLKLNNSKSD